MEGSPDSTPSGLQRWGASRWANCLATVLTPIIISQTWLQRPTDSQTSQSSGRTEQQSAAILRRQDQSRSQLCTAKGINLCWNGTRVKRVGGYRDRRWWGTKRRCSLYSCYHDYQASIPQQMEEKIFLLEKLSIWTIWKPWTPDWEHTGETRFFLFFFNKSINVLLVLGQHREDSFSEKVFKWLNTILPKDILLSGVLMTEAKSTVGWALGLNSRVQQVSLGNKRARIFKLHRVITAQWLHDFVWRTYGMMLYRAAAEVEIRLTLLPSGLDFLLAHKFVEMNEGLSEHITPKSPIGAYSWWLWRP